MYLLKVLIEQIIDIIRQILKRPKVGGKIDVCLTLLAVLGLKRCIPVNHPVGLKRFV